MKLKNVGIENSKRLLKVGLSNKRVIQNCKTTERIGNLSQY
jgi:hypothetical protein